MANNGIISITDGKQTNTISVTLKKGHKVYLAIPYSGLEQESYVIANLVMAKLMNAGILVFSPISMCHQAARVHKLPGDWEFWKKLDESMIEWADAIMVVNIGSLSDRGANRGFELIENSKGVQAEIKMAKDTGKHIIYYFHETE